MTFVKKIGVALSSAVAIVLPVAASAAPYTYSVSAPTASGDLVTSLYNFAAALVQYALDLATNNIGLLTFGAFLGLGMYLWHFIKSRAAGGRR